MLDFLKKISPSDKRILLSLYSNSDSTISQIKKGIRKISPKRAKIMEQLTNGRIPAHALRPDIFDKPK